MGHIFNYILKTRDFQKDFIGRYKDEKACSYFDNGFVDETLTRTPDVVIKTVYCKVHGLQFRIMRKYCWVYVLGVGASQCCNRVTASLYKIEYANRNG